MTQPLLFSAYGLVIAMATCFFGWAIGYASKLYRDHHHTPTTRFCRDCRWVKPNDILGPAYGRCMHPKALRSHSQYLAAGEYEEENQRHCTSMRENKDCGKAGLLWEPR